MNADRSHFYRHFPGLFNELFYEIFHELFRTLEDWIFPPRCPVCDELLGPGDRRIHASCRRELYPTGEQVCVRCGRPLVRERDEYCRECRKKREPGGGSFNQAKALLEYRGAVKISMYRLKYSNRREYARFYAEAAGQQYGKWIRDKEIECIIPVPMYGAKKRLRGYNQAEIFARELGYCLQLPVETKLVARVKDTKPLKSMNGQERRQTLQDAFRTNEACMMRQRYRSVLLTDDIYTTGSTVSEIAACLKRAGVEQVYVLTICTAPA